MGKRIIQQARGKGSLTYRVRRQAFRHSIKYTAQTGEAEIINIVHSAGHTAPLLKLKISNEIFYNPAFNGSFVGQKIFLNNEAKDGNITPLKNIPVRTQVYNIERNPGDGGKMMRAAGTSALVSKKLEKDKIVLLMPNKREVILHGNCRATVGIVAGDARIAKPLFKAGKKYYKMRARGKLWPSISAVSVNAVDHPFGSGRGKRVKSKIAKRNAPPGRKVGHLRPRRTGKRK